LAVVIMVAGIAYNKIFYSVKRLFNKVEVPIYRKPAIGGLLVGAIGFFVPDVLGPGYGPLQSALNGNMTVWFMLALAGLKILATSFTIQSGASGGVFGPSLVIGRLLGGVIGYAIEALVPGTISSPEACVLDGLASFLDGVATVPVSVPI